ncbi:ADP-ribosyltransferase [Bacillus thuringiensis]|nr:ADP-ribosyltransferase [Bacillus thuringiensis]
MNEVLRTGKNSQEPVTKKMLEAYTKEFTPIMDSVFKKPQAKLSVGLRVYRYTNELQFGFELGAFFQNEKVNQSGIEKFKKQFEGKTFHDKGFTSTSLALVNLPPGSLGNAERFASRTIRMDIKVPKGSSAVYLDNLYAEVVLPRESTFKINKVSGIVEKGKLIMKIDAELIQKN